MPAQDDGCVRPNESKRTRTMFYVGYEQGEVPLSPTDSSSTDYLEDNVTPPVITPHTSSQSSFTSGTTVSMTSSSSEDNMIIPLYLFHIVERNSLNIEFNRCLQLSLLNPSQHFCKPKDEEHGEGTSGGAGPSTRNADASTPEHVPTILVDSGTFEQLLQRINHYVSEFNPPELMMDYIMSYLDEVQQSEDKYQWVYQCPGHTGWVCQHADDDEWVDIDENYEPRVIPIYHPSPYLFPNLEEGDLIIPPYMFPEYEEDGVIIPPYMFQETEEGEVIIPPYRFPIPDEDGVIIPPFMFPEAEDDELIIPAYIFEEPEPELELSGPTFQVPDEEDSQQEEVETEKVFDLLAGGDFSDLDLEKCNPE